MARQSNSSCAYSCSFIEGVIKGGRALIGATDPLNAAPGTIRGDLAIGLVQFAFAACRCVSLHVAACRCMSLHVAACRCMSLHVAAYLHVAVTHFSEGRRNLIHGSDGPESAEREIALWFSGEEVVEHNRALDAWLYE